MHLIVRSCKILSRSYAMIIWFRMQFCGGTTAFPSHANVAIVAVFSTQTPACPWIIPSFLPLRYTCAPPLVHTCTCAQQKYARKQIHTSLQNQHEPFVHALAHARIRCLSAPTHTSMNAHARTVTAVPCGTKWPYCNTCSCVWGSLKALSCNTCSPIHE